MSAFTCDDRVVAMVLRCLKNVPCRPSKASLRTRRSALRKEAFEGLHGTFFKQRNTIATTLSSQVKADIFYTQQRGYPSCREHALAEDNIPTSVYDNLVETVSEHIPLLDRYLKLRK